MLNYDEFIKRKASEDVVSGFDPQDLGGHLFDFQALRLITPLQIADALREVMRRTAEKQVLQ